MENKVFLLRIKKILLLLYSLSGIIQLYQIIHAFKNKFNDSLLSEHRELKLASELLPCALHVL